MRTLLAQAHPLPLRRLGTGPPGYSAPPRGGIRGSGRNIRTGGRAWRVRAGPGDSERAAGAGSALRLGAGGSDDHDKPRNAEPVSGWRRFGERHRNWRHWRRHRRRNWRWQCRRERTALHDDGYKTWGIQAITAVQSLGVNPSAIAATCVLESGCQNVGGSGGAQGAFQMFPAAFNEGLRTALAANPALALQIVPGDAGRMDPVTEAIAAAGYQMQAVQSLQSANIGDPTVLDTRSYYEFGPQFAAPVATAADSQSLAALVPASFLTKNNIPMGTTVGQWRASVATKIGNAAGQSVLS